MQTLVAVLQVAAGLGFVIFVHELGHFLVAKACGVRCDKFFVGFDIGGIKLSKKWGETEYGIGVLPLGGYVKMYGQEDNAAALAEELENAKSLEGDPDAVAVTAPNGEKVWINKRSYLAKNVPQRMAIISAGVIMNVIFAVVMAWVAFGVGVPETPVVIGQTVTGGAAWQAGLKTGDRLARVNGMEDPSFDQLTKAVVLGDIDKGVECEVERRDGGFESITLTPVNKGLAPQIGVTNTSRLRLANKDAVRPHSPAAGENGFKDKDQIVEVNGQPVDTFTELLAVQMTQRDQPISYTVIRGGKAPIDNPFGMVEGGERLTFEVGPNPMERLGVVATIGPVVALEAGSPAEQAGLQVGDLPRAVDGVAIGASSDGELALDPVTLDNRLSTAASRGEHAVITVERDGQLVDLEVEPRVVTWLSATAPDAGLALNAIGAACELHARVAAITAGSPAVQADLRVGDEIEAAVVRFEKPSGLFGSGGGKQPITLEFDEKNQHWAVLLSVIQDPSPELEVTLKVARGGSQGDAQVANSSHTVTLKPEAVSQEFTAERGFELLPLKRLKVADTLGEQTQLAFQETGDQLMSVLRFLQKIGGQVSVKALGGPITIARHAGNAAFEGVGALLMSLVMLSANLAVLNFLPIPVLDGGHMVFLAYEGITGRPPSERIMIALQYVGLFFLLGLMMFVFTLDISRLLGISL